MSSFHVFLIRSGLVILVINLVGLWMFNYWQYQKLDALSKTDQLVGDPTAIKTRAVPSAQPTQPYVVPVSTTSSDVSRLDALEKRVSTLEKTQPQTITTSAPSRSSATTLYMGSGSTTNQEWTTIPGASIGFTTAEYSGLTKARFEASLGIVGGEAQARLVHRSTGAILDITTLVHNTNTSTWKYSPTFSLTAGGHEYVVQLRSSSGEVARLEGARIILLP